MSDAELQSFDINGIKECQQNRHPILFLDKVIDVIPEKCATGIKAFSYNEWFFPAHYEDEPSVPGFIMVETMVQTFIMTFLTLPQYKGSKTNFLNLNNACFRRQIVPGDTLVVKSSLDSLRRGIAKGRAEAHVGDEFACSADFVVSIRSATDAIFKKMREKHN